MSRPQFSDNELDNGIFNPRKDKPVQDEVVLELTYYTVEGKHDRHINGLPVIDDDGKLAYAKRDGQKLYVKSNGGQLADPRGLYDNDLYKRIGDKDVWTWRRVNFKAFDYYLAYLKTANKSHYRNASREIF